MVNKKEIIYHSHMDLPIEIKRIMALELINNYEKYDSNNHMIHVLYDILNKE